MSKKSLTPIQAKADYLLESVGDMSLKRRAKKIINDLDLRMSDEILDIGCGDGYFLYLLSSLPIKTKLIGFDKDNNVLHNAKKNLKGRKIKFIKGDIQELPFKKNSINKVIITEVLEHISDDKKALSEIYRILKPKGKLLMTVPNFSFPFLWDPLNWILQNLFGTHISGTSFFAGIWARHLRLYKRKELEKLIKKAGFKIEKTEELTTRCLPFNHYLVNLVARWLYDIKPKGRIADSLSKFKKIKKPYLFRFAFFLVNIFDKLNDILPGRHGVNIYIKAKK